MKLAETMDLFGEERDYSVVSTRTDAQSEGAIGTRDSRVIHRNLTKEEAERASLAMPFTKVVKGVLPEEDPELREAARRKAQRENPDVD